MAVLSFLWLIVSGNFWRKLSETEVGIQGITFSFLSGESQEVTLI